MYHRDNFGDWRIVKAMFYSPNWRKVFSSPRKLLCDRSVPYVRQTSHRRTQESYNRQWMHDELIFPNVTIDVRIQANKYINSSWWSDIRRIIRVFVVAKIVFDICHRSYSIITHTSPIYETRQLLFNHVFND